MTTSRRSLLAAGTTGTIALTAGCLDFLTGDGPLKFTAERVAPTDAALEETGFEEDTVEKESFEETIDVGVERDVEASIWVSIYTKQLAEWDQDAGVFAAVSAPGMEVGGRTINPLEELSNRELLEEFLDEVETGTGIDDLEYEESDELTVLGEDRTVETFSGRTEYNGLEVDVAIELASFVHEDDLIVLLGSYPTPLEELPEMDLSESENVERLMESVQHPV